MRISDFIEFLEELQRKHGDIWFEHAPGGRMVERVDVEPVINRAGETVAVYIAPPVKGWGRG